MGNKADYGLSLVALDILDHSPPLRFSNMAIKSLL